MSQRVNNWWIDFFFFNCYLAVPRPTLGHSQGDSLTNPLLITVFVYIRPEGHREPFNEVGSLSPAECLAGFEPGTFRFLLQCLNPTSDGEEKAMDFDFFCDKFSQFFLGDTLTFSYSIVYFLFLWAPWCFSYLRPVGSGKGGMWRLATPVFGYEVKLQLIINKIWKTWNPWKKISQFI